VTGAPRFGKALRAGRSAAVTETLMWDEILAPGPDDADWGDVVRRAGRARWRRRVGVAAAVAAVVVVSVASAYALGHPIVDFQKSPKGPIQIVNDFGSLEVWYADGTTAEIPFVWVTQPIDAGFYLYRVPNAHRVEAARPTAVTLYDGHGKTLAREDVPGIPASIRSLNQHRIEGYPLLSV